MNGCLLPDKTGASLDGGGGGRLHSGWTRVRQTDRQRAVQFTTERSHNRHSEAGTIVLEPAWELDKTNQHNDHMDRIIHFYRLLSCGGFTVLHSRQALKFNQRATCNMTGKTRRNLGVHM